MLHRAGFFDVLYRFPPRSPAPSCVGSTCTRKVFEFFSLIKKRTNLHDKGLV
jgi:hypothetical protein